MLKIYLKNKNKYCFVDNVDYKRLSKHRWTMNSSGYAVRRKKKTDEECKTTYILMHRDIVGASKGDFVDHVNMEKLDNRKNNLRICSNAENLRNRIKRGVYYDKKRMKWVVQPRNKNGKKVFLGRYKDLKKAVTVFNKNIVLLHGDFAVKSSITI